MNQVRLFALMSVGMIAGQETVRADVILYSQPAQYPGNFGGTYTSDYGFDPAVAGNRGFWTFDNFQPVTSGRVDQITFQGMYRDFQVNGNNPVAPETTSWEFAFWSNNPGFFPSSQLSVQTLPAAAVQSEYAGPAVFFNLPGVIHPVYNFTANLSQPFNVQAGTTYWLSILSLSPTLNPIWIWMPGNGGPDGQSIQYTLGNGRTITNSRRVRNDRAFALVQVPEPATLAVLAGVLGIGGFFARRRPVRPA